MARLNSTTEVIHDLRSVGFYSDTTPATTLSAEEAAGQNVLSVAAGGSFTADSVIRIGDNGSTADLAVVTSATASAITVDHGIIYTQANGAAVTTLLFADMGHTTDAGVTIEYSGDENELNVGTQVGTYLYMGGAVNVGITFSLVNVSMENLLAAAGIPESGVLSTPDGANLDPATLATDTKKAWRLQGLDDGANTVTFYLFAASVAVPNFSLQYSTGTAMEVQINLRSVNVIRVTRE
jgi:hypothetical protein